MQVTSLPLYGCLPENPYPQNVMTERRSPAQDHDLLIELRTELRALREDIKAMKDNILDQIKDHENRLRTLEGESNQHKWLWPAIAGGFGVLATGVIEFFVRKYHG